VIEDLGAFPDTTVIHGDIAIVGAGPAGIVVALEAAKHGIKVVLLESGKESFEPGLQQLSAAAEWDHHRHAPMTMAVRRQVGGTSVIWGGRCVPYDPVDFDTRPIAGSASWPVTYEEMSGYFQRACDWLVCGRNVFNVSGLPHLPEGIIPGLVDGDVTTSSLERWSLPTNFGKTYARNLQDSLNVRLLTGVTCTEVVCPRETSEADHLVARTLAGGELQVKAKAFVIASGGLESTRLLMDSEGPNGGQLGNESGHLGRWYMAHLEGVVANVQFSTPPRSTVYGYERDIDGVYVRRRFCFTRNFQLQRELPNVAGWIANPELPDARHRSGQLSFVYLALSSRLGPKFAPEAQRLSMTGTEIPGTPYGGAKRSSHLSHIRNVLAEPLATGRFMFDFGAKRFLARHRRAPGFFVYSKSNVYPFEYHGEHLPHPDSRVSLSPEKDELGRRKLNIDLRFSDADVDGIVRAHRHWDEYLRSSGLGSMQYLHPDTHEAVTRRLGGGFHQIGTTRMAAASSGGVVDKNLTVHGTTNVFVASSSTFVTSGQANSTFMIVAFAVRLADHLRHKLLAEHG
jgi:choline dehydrogenase-like flavoprotein